jgi:hypothetical protein
MPSKSWKYPVHPAGGVVGTQRYAPVQAGSEQSALAHECVVVVVVVVVAPPVPLVVPVVPLDDDPPVLPDDVLAIVPVDVDDELAVAPPPLGRS